MFRVLAFNSLVWNRINGFEVFSAYRVLISSRVAAGRGVLVCGIWRLFPSEDAMERLDEVVFNFTPWQRVFAALMLGIGGPADGLYVRLSRGSSGPRRWRRDCCSAMTDQEPSLFQKLNAPSRAT